jgi:hypothetical protein
MQLTQRRSPFSGTTFRLGETLEVTERSLFRKVEVQFGLDRMTPKPLQVRDFPARWALASLVLGLLTLSAVADGWATREMGTIFGVLFLGACTAACLFNAWQLYRNVLVFRDRHTGQTLFVMLRASPTAGEVDRFVGRIAELADRPRMPLGASRQEIAAFHARLVQQLFEEGVLLGEEYRTITARLAAGKAPSTVVSLVGRET